MVRGPTRLARVVYRRARIRHRGRTASRERALDDSTRVILLRGFARGSFRYLENAENGVTWQRVWGRGVSAPLAIGVILDRDTLIVPVGERG